MTREPVPAVPAGAGPRVMMLIWAAACVFGLGILALVVVGAPAALAHAFGLADTSTAEVTDRSFRPLDSYSRGCDSYYDFDVAWDDRDGHFSVCITDDDPLVDLEVGDEVEVSSVSWSSSVVPEGQPGGSGWAVLALVAGILIPAYSAVLVLRYRRIARGTALGTLMTGFVTRAGRTTISVRLGDRRLVMMPAKHVLYLSVGDPAEVWSTRRSLFRKRPRGPWVVRARGAFGVFSHAWWRSGRPGQTP